MSVDKHIIISFPLGFIYYLFSKSVFLALLTMFSSVIIDFDHFIDYLITQKRLDSLKSIINAFSTFKVIRKNYFFFHSWEILIFFFIIIVIYSKNIMVALFIGYSIHLLIDQVYNTQFLGKYNCRNLFYFFSYRLIKRFDVLKLRKKTDEINLNERIYKED